MFYCTWYINRDRCSVHVLFMWRRQSNTLLKYLCPQDQQSKATHLASSQCSQITLNNLKLDIGSRTYQPILNNNHCACSMVWRSFGSCYLLYWTLAFIYPVNSWLPIVNALHKVTIFWQWNMLLYCGIISEIKSTLTWPVIKVLFFSNQIDSDTGKKMFFLNWKALL